MTDFEEKSEFTSLWDKKPSESDGWVKDPVSRISLTFAVVVLLLFATGAGVTQETGFFGWLAGIFEEVQQDKDDPDLDQQQVAQANGVSPLLEDPNKDKKPEQQVKEEELAVGGDLDDFKMNFVSHDDFKEMMARLEYKKDQPALQSQAERDPDATRTPLDPLDPTPQQSRASKQSPAIVKNFKPEQQPQTPSEPKDAQAKAEKTQGQENADPSEKFTTRNPGEIDHADVAPELVKIAEDQTPGASSTENKTETQEPVKLTSSEKTDSKSPEWARGEKAENLSGDTNSKAPVNTTDTNSIETSPETEIKDKPRPVVTSNDAEDQRPEHVVTHQDNESEDTGQPEIKHRATEREPVPEGLAKADNPNEADVHENTTRDPELEKMKLARANRPTAHLPEDPAETDHLPTNAARTVDRENPVRGDVKPEGKVENDPQRQGGLSQTPSQDEQVLPKSEQQDDPRDRSVEDNDESPTRVTTHRDQTHTTSVNPEQQPASKELDPIVRVKEGDQTQQDMEQESEQTTPQPKRNQANPGKAQPQVVTRPQPNTLASPTKPRPTQADRSKSESLAVSQITGESIRAGQTKTMQGVKIITKMPRFSGAAVTTFLPSHVIVDLVFNRDGKVEKVNLVNPTGNAMIDAPLEAALYEWEASGKLFKKRNRPFYLNQLRIDFR